MASDDKPLVVITGAAGNIGRSLAAALRHRYSIVGIDLKGGGTDFPVIEADFTSDDSMAAAMEKLPRFILLTLLGAGIWTGLLAMAGYWLGAEYRQVARYLGPASTIILGSAFVYYIYRVVTFRRR